MKKLLKITNFNYQNIFHNFSLELQEGNITMISGNNKCGKTTLIKAIGQIIPTIDTIEYTFGDPFIKQENIGISLSLADDYGNQTVLNVLQNDEDEYSKIDEYISDELKKDPDIISLIEKKRLESELSRHSNVQLQSMISENDEIIAKNQKEIDSARQSLIEKIFEQQKIIKEQEAQIAKLKSEKTK